MAYFLGVIITLNRNFVLLILYSSSSSPALFLNAVRVLCGHPEGLNQFMSSQSIETSTDLAGLVSQLQTLFQP